MILMASLSPSMFEILKLIRSNTTREEIPSSSELSDLRMKTEIHNTKVNAIINLNSSPILTQPILETCLLNLEKEQRLSLLRKLKRILRKLPTEIRNHPKLHMKETQKARF
jgi:hypothetical protein